VLQPRHRLRHKVVMERRAAEAQRIDVINPLCQNE